VTTITGYTVRARFYPAEIAAVPEPQLLAGLLRPGLRVAEMPSATGHFLHAYAAHQAEVILIDACQDMLSAGGQRARDIGIQAFSLVCGLIQDLTGETGRADLVVIPNAALNQLAVGTHPVTLLRAAVRVMRPGGLLLAQILDLRDDGSIGACGFYTPGTPDQELITDRQFTDEDGSRLVRRRQQSRDGRLLYLQFELLRNGRPLYRHCVDLRVLPVPEVHTALSAAGLVASHVCHGTGGLVEILARAESAS
jgi:SAM-dependent methyltransferase